MSFLISENILKTKQNNKFINSLKVVSYTFSLPVSISNGYNFSLQIFFYTLINVKLIAIISKKFLCQKKIALNI